MPTKPEYGKSITDACIGWDGLQDHSVYLSDAVVARRKRFHAGLGGMGEQPGLGELFFTGVAVFFFSRWFWVGAQEVRRRQITSHAQWSPAAAENG